MLNSFNSGLSTFTNIFPLDLINCYNLGFKLDISKEDLREKICVEKNFNQIKNFILQTGLANFNFNLPFQQSLEMGI
ncbi:hypothetical protein BpHYR1_033680 [Brachionus plicatilis]|uniref:Uncharacterized protein n=1 Tax=Brachionus plicatilis TaxID=10195 RepID=A0A3M7Q821_BRAPC|nr:hypothetical protein BpHYR1_033680 [Brachionus plicatilis]